MSLTITLTDDMTSKTYTETSFEDNLTIERVAGKSTNTTLNGNVYTDYVYSKKEWTVKWAFMSATDYADLVGFYERQFSLDQYPVATIVTPTGTHTSPVCIDINDQKITNKCGVVEDITITLRETVQL